MPLFFQNSFNYLLIVILPDFHFWYLNEGNDVARRVSLSLLLSVHNYFPGYKM